MHDPAKNPEIHYDPKNPETLEITYDIDIDLEDLPVPKPIVNGSGFQPTIDGWQGVEIPVDMQEISIRNKEFNTQNAKKSIKMFAI